MKKLTGSRNQCAGCKEYFNSNHAFEKHRIGEFGVNRRCKTTEEITNSGYRLNKKGFWGEPITDSDLNLMSSGWGKVVADGVE